MKACVFFVSLLLSLSGSLRAQAGTIPVILSSESTIYESVLSGIGSAMNRRLTVQYLDAIIARYPDPAAYFQALEAQKPELVITIGSAASTLARDNLKQTPIVFSMVNTPKIGRAHV